MIRFEDVRVRYPRATRAAVDGVTLEAPRGTIVAVAGPNGSGKSTLVRTLLRAHPLESGRVLIDGTPLHSLDRRAVARRVAVVTQREEPVFPLSVREYVALGRYPHEGPWRGEGADDAAAIARAIALSSVESLVERDVGTLSGGEWQRVRIARGLAQGGDAIVLDEPTTFLDIGHEMAAFELLAVLAGEGLAVLVVSHQLNLVARFADTLVLLHEGRVAAAGPPSSVMRAEILEPIYEWPLLITRDPAVGAPALVPLRARRAPREER